MIYGFPSIEDAVDQGDLIDGCPFLMLANYEPGDASSLLIHHSFGRVLVPTQTCDLANEKALNATVANVFDAHVLVNAGLLKAGDIRGSIRAGRVYGWYFLPRDLNLGLPEMIVDLRQLHTVRLDLLRALCRQGKRRGRVQPLYREHLAKHFADTYSRIGLPRPYETM